MTGEFLRSEPVNKRTAFRKKRQNRFSMFLAILVVAILLIVVSIGSLRLTGDLESKEKRKAELEAQIEAEQERAEQLEEYEKYVQTDQFKEKMAREKLGMVKDGEIVFENEDSR